MQIHIYIYIYTYVYIYTLGCISISSTPSFFETIAVVICNIWSLVQTDSPEVAVTEASPFVSVSASVPVSLSFSVSVSVSLLVLVSSSKLGLMPAGVIPATPLLLRRRALVRDSTWRFALF